MAPGLLAPGAASAMPIVPSVAVAGAASGRTLQVQWLPRNYPFDPCAPGAPPIRVVKRDDWGRAFIAIEPAYGYCREARGEVYLLPPPPHALAVIPPSGYDGRGRPVYRWRLVPAW
ncbi:hypothetical protein [Phreatobacter stygius]|uniref:Uncharacterized protein n=1 Tax=Phreatobacter stygius TaxID=1940610 RepID=A0A4D7B1E3_9HYPH|nr:hypothetical protein [Phreatobacter stygius]QCI63850.1 hypothetical protein E8M01_06080 [Phreatobacter stygius]